MSNVVTTLLDFILDLLRDPAAAAEYDRDPHAAIQNAGLDVSPADVSASMAAVSDCSPVRGWEGGVSDYHPSQPYAPQHEYHPQAVDAYHVQPQPQPEHCDDDHKHDDHKHDDHKAWEDHAQGQEMAVIQHVTHIENDITLTKIDASHSVWVNGDVNLLFGDHDILQTGSGTALNDVEAEKGGSIDVHNTPVSVSLADSLNGSFNEAGDGGIAGGSGNTVDSSDHSVSFDDLNLGDNSGNNEDATDSGNSGSVVGNVGPAQLGDNTTTTTTTTTSVTGNGNATGPDAEVHNTNSFDTISGSDASLAGGAQDNDTNSDNSDSNVANEHFGQIGDSDDHTNVDVHTGNIATDGSIGGDYEPNEQHFLSDNAVAVDDAAAVTEPHLDLGLLVP